VEEGGGRSVSVTATAEISRSSVYPDLSISLFFIITALTENANLSINGRNTILPAVIDFDGDDKTL